ncbi:uncharacterized protein LOC128724114 [Anopheles nili]|uniref:uncharacterized protein LOC128724114 n=1 Tax=Anopheles nili TaxID=185578 RepID=UPI00237B75AD|nr:uncharacterized protein LOC128724114 [Anopheles nili]
MQEESSMDGMQSDESNTEQVIVPGKPLREQDRFLPIANITKIMKKAIPKNGKIAKESRECIQECVSEFISFITSEACDRCHMEKRKTINAEDILCAMYALGFENYVEPLKIYLNKYKDTIMTDRVNAEETGESSKAGESSGQPQASCSKASEMLPTDIANTEIIYQSDDGTLYFKNDTYETM